MGSRVVRSLVLACSLVLALPQGWCCLFACHTAKASETAAANSDSDLGDLGCPHCANQTAPTSGPTDQPTPTENPAAPCHSVCPCADRQSTVPTSVSIVQLDTGAALFLLPYDTTTSNVGLVAEVDGFNVLPPKHPLHVLKRFWLC